MAEAQLDERQISQVVRRIVEQFSPERIILFGSYARDQAHPDSDLDLFVEMESSRRPPERAVEISRAFGLRRWPMDIIVYTPAEAARLRQVPSSFINRIEAEGRLLYER